METERHRMLSNKDQFLDSDREEFDGDYYTVRHTMDFGLWLLVLHGRHSGERLLVAQPAIEGTARRIGWIRGHEKVIVRLKVTPETEKDEINSWRLLALEDYASAYGHAFREDPEDVLARCLSSFWQSQFARCRQNGRFENYTYDGIKMTPRGTKYRPYR